MSKEVRVTFEPQGKTILVPRGITILEAARLAGIKIRSECGGQGLCGKCRILVRPVDATTKITDVERRWLTDSELKQGYRLACQAKVLENLVVIVPLETRLVKAKIIEYGYEYPLPFKPLVKKVVVRIPKAKLSDLRPDLERVMDVLRDNMGIEVDEIDYHALIKLPQVLRDGEWIITVTIWDGNKVIDFEKGDTSKHMYGVAIDIGTSKIVCHLVDLHDGKSLAVGSLENPQLAYGEDVISRIRYCMIRRSGLKELRAVVIDAINFIIGELCKKVGINRNNIYEAVVVGNTAMHHIFLGIVPNYLALSPYVPGVRRSLNVKARDVGLLINSGANVYLPPIIAGFVGADAVADIIATGMIESDDIVMLIDIGTNTEVCLGNREVIWTASCASGPAFEGAHIRFGMKAIPGAIEHVKIIPKSNGYDVKYSVIGDTRPVGICGSAMIDVIAELLKNGIIDRSGRFVQDKEDARIKVGKDGKEFIIAYSDETEIGRDIVITQKDIRQIQLAKAAIYAACKVLMRKAGISEADIRRVYIAGAFGRHIDAENAKIIGLLPNVPSGIVEFVGNTAVAGARLLLKSRIARKYAEELLKIARYVELTVEPEFSQEFLKATYFPDIKEHMHSTPT